MGGGVAEWYRSTSWNPDSFEEHLARARPSRRPQYLRVQGLTFLETGKSELQAVAIELLERLYADESENAPFEYPTAPEFLGQAYEAAGDFERAAALYLEAIDRQRGARHRGNPEFRLGAMVVRETLSAHYRHTLEVLTDPALDRHTSLDWHRFERARCVAFLAERLGQTATARASAAQALELATRTKPQFPRHPRVGVIQTDETLLNALRRIASDN